MLFANYSSFGCVQAAVDNTIYEGVFWEISPYFYTSSEGHYTGMLADVFNQYREFCFQQKSDYISYNVKMESEADMIEVFRIRKRYFAERNSFEARLGTYIDHALIR